MFEAICHCDVLCLEISVVASFVEASESFGLEWAFGGQILEGDCGSVKLESEVVD